MVSNLAKMMMGGVPGDHDDDHHEELDPETVNKEVLRMKRRSSVLSGVHVTPRGSIHHRGSAPNIKLAHGGWMLPRFSVTSDDIKEEIEPWIPKHRKQSAIKGAHAKIEEGTEDEWNNMGFPTIDFLNPGLDRTNSRPGQGNQRTDINGIDVIDMLNKVTPSNQPEVILSAGALSGAGDDGPGGAGRKDDKGDGHDFESIKERMDPDLLIEPEGGRCDQIRNNPVAKYFIKRIPIISWLPTYRPSDIVADCIAGITVGLTVIPQGIAYAGVAGLPPQYGLYSAFMGCFVYTFFGSCKDITIGPTAIMALMSGEHAKFGPDFAVLLAFLSGFIILSFGILKLGFLIDFISVPVIAGFTSAAALTIASGQVKSLLGISFPEEYHKSHTHAGVVDKWVDIFNNIQSTRWQDAVLGFICCFLLLGLRSLNRTNWFKEDREGNATGIQAMMNRLPRRVLQVISKIVWLVCTARNALIVVGCLIISGLADPECVDHLDQLKMLKTDPNITVNGSCIFTITGSITPGLPPFSSPPFSTIDEATGKEVSFGGMLEILSSAIIILPLIAILENVAIAKAFAGGKPVDASQEMIALGFCNIMASFVSSMPITGSFSRTAVNSASGVRTPMGGVLTGLLVILCLQFLIPFCAFIPKASLSAVIITAVIFSVEVHVVKPLWRSKRIDMLPGIGCFLGCLFYELAVGILIGVAIQTVFILYNSARPKMEVELKQIPGDNQGKVVLITVMSDVIFPSVTHVRNYISKAGLREGGPEIPVVIECSRITSTDFTAAEGFNAMMGDFKSRNSEVYWLNPNESVVHTLGAILGNKFKVIHDLSDLSDVVPSSVRIHND